MILVPNIARKLPKVGIRIVGCKVSTQMEILYTAGHRQSYEPSDASGNAVSPRSERASWATLGDQRTCESRESFIVFAQGVGGIQMYWRKRKRGHSHIQSSGILSDEKPLVGQSRRQTDGYKFSDRDGTVSGRVNFYRSRSQVCHGARAGVWGSL